MDNLLFLGGMALGLATLASAIAAIKLAEIGCRRSRVCERLALEFYRFGYNRAVAKQIAYRNLTIKE